MTVRSADPIRREDPFDRVDDAGISNDFEGNLFTELSQGAHRDARQLFLVLGVTQPIQEFLELGLLLLEAAQRLHAVLVEGAVTAGRRAETETPAAALHAVLDEANEAGGGGDEPAPPPDGGE